MHFSRFLRSFPELRLFRVTHLDCSAERICVSLVTRRRTAPCPLCGRLARRQQSTYLRTLHDLPWRGIPVVLQLRVRRFFCANHACPRRIFAEQFPDLAPARARSTIQRRRMTHHIGLALGGQAGSRLARHAGTPTSRATLLRQVQSSSPPQQLPPRVIGIDEWAWRRGLLYGTILVDLERHRVLDLLPDRSVASVAHWLRQHPQVDVVCRDRSSLFAEAIAQGAPQATQVVDRWHLLRNLRDVLESLFTRYKPTFQQAMPPSPLAIGVLRPSHRAVPRQAAATRKRRQCHVTQRYQQIHDLAARHLTQQAIAQRVGVTTKTVQRYLRLAQPPAKQPIRHTALERYLPYLLRRWNEGCRNARQLWREIVADGYPHGRSPIERFIGELRRQEGSSFHFRTVAAQEVFSEADRPRRPLTTLQAARLFIRHAEDRGTWERDYLARLLQSDESLARTAGQVDAFCDMLRHRQGHRLQSWLEDVEQQGEPEMQAFARNLRKEESAVQAGLTLAWSNGPTEGFVCRLKLLKRQAYGRAGVDLLKHRMLAHSVELACS